MKLFSSFILGCVGCGVAVWAWPKGKITKTTETVTEVTEKGMTTNPRFVLAKSSNGTELWIPADQFLNLQVGGGESKTLNFKQVTVKYGDTKLTKNHLLYSPDTNGIYYFAEYKQQDKWNQYYVLEDKSRANIRDIDRKLKDSNHASIVLKNDNWQSRGWNSGLSKIWFENCSFTWNEGTSEMDWSLTVKCFEDLGGGYKLWATKTLNKDNYSLN